jgi:hypothetical protein
MKDGELFIWGVFSVVLILAMALGLMFNVNDILNW